jgi:hypothetical protein
MTRRHVDPTLPPSPQPIADTSPLSVPMRVLYTTLTLRRLRPGAPFTLRVALIVFGDCASIPAPIVVADAEPALVLVRIRDTVDTGVAVWTGTTVGRVSHFVTAA